MQFRLILGFTYIKLHWCFRPRIEFREWRRVLQQLLLQWRRVHSNCPLVLSGAHKGTRFDEHRNGKTGRHQSRHDAEVNNFLMREFHFPRMERVQRRCHFKSTNYITTDQNKMSNITCKELSKLLHFRSRLALANYEQSCDSDQHHHK